MPAPYLRRIWIDPARVPDPDAYPFCLPYLQNEFELSFDRAITIIVGENGTGKSTLLEGIAGLVGFDEAGGGKGYMPVDHSKAIEAMGAELAEALRASWLPKIADGWFFRAESFFSVARYLDEEGKALGMDRLISSPTRTAKVFALLRRALPAAGHLHLRRAGIGAIAGAPDRIPQAVASHGPFGNLPGRHGYACADADGLSKRASAAIVEIRTGDRGRRGHRSLQGDARVLRRSRELHGSGDRGVRWSLRSNPNFSVIPGRASA